MIVGISGFKGAGKGFVASVLQKHGFVKMSCSAPLKDMVSILFCWSRDLLEGDTDESRRWREIPDSSWKHLAGTGIFKDDPYITPRIALQRIGTNLFRNHVHSDFWIMLLMRRIKNMESTYQREGITLYDGTKVPYMGVVLDDARFLNELSQCNYTILVTRGTHTDNDIKQMHESETEHLKHNFHCTIYNTSTLYDLQRKVEAFIIPKLYTQS